MKKFILALTFLVLTFSFMSGQKKAVTQVPVTTATIARQGTTKPYTLDLTKKGTIYTIAKDVDYNRVSVHTAKGDVTVADLIKKSGKDISGRLRIGVTSDIRTQRLALASRGGGRLNYSCGDLACVCTGDDDCNDLFSSTNCGPIAVCYEDGCFCLRL